MVCEKGLGAKETLPHLSSNNSVGGVQTVGGGYYKGLFFRFVL